jgi:hypothetical protein
MIESSDVLIVRAKSMCACVSPLWVVQSERDSYLVIRLVRIRPIADRPSGSAGSTGLLV